MGAGGLDEVAAALLALEGEVVGPGQEVAALGQLPQEVQVVAPVLGERARGREARRPAREARNAARIEAREAERRRYELVRFKCDHAGCTFDGDHTREAIDQHKKNHREIDRANRDRQDERAAAQQRALAARGRQHGHQGRRAARARGQILQ